MFEDYKILFDYDGVILDSEENIINLRNQNENLSWDEFFSTVDWDRLYNDSNEINESLKILKKLQSEREELYIITKTHNLKEGLSKIKRIRKEGIMIPILIVPPHIKKSEVFIPNKKSLLIDDGEKNIKDWENNGGTGLLFDSKDTKEEKQKVKSLHFLLKG